MIKTTLIFFVLMSSIQLSSQELILPKKSSTSFSLNYGINVTYSSKLFSRSIGGQWGFVVDHVFADNKWGFTAGINYSLIHIGLKNEFTSPSRATEYGMLESTFGVLYHPLEESKNLRINLGFTHALVVKSSYYPPAKDNIPIASFGAEYILPTKSSLAIAFGINNRIYTINSRYFGFNSTNVFYCKIGMKN